MQLRSQIVFQIPFPNGTDKQSEVEELIRMVISNFTNWFGKAYRREDNFYTADGTTNGIIVIIWSWCTTVQLQNFSPCVVALIRDVKNRLKCDDVFVIINGKMYTISD